jgi:glycosyltransferase involved in cell wall biosynthesis
VALATAILNAAVLFRLRALPSTAVLPGPFDEAPNARGATVVIAARDEAESIVECLRSILADAAVERVIVVDDHSTDATAEFASKEASADARVRLLSAPDLPPGWVGKSHALHHGAQFVESHYILFVDADVKVEPGLVSAAVGKMASENLDHLSGFFKVHCATIGEQVCAPVLATTAAIALFGSAPSGAATGAFNLIRADFYRRLGGHVQIKEAIVDDVHLARLAARNGARTCFLDFSAGVSVRLFKGLSGFFRAVVRSTQSYLGNNVVLPILGGFGALLIGVLTILNLIFAGWVLLPGEPEVGGWPGWLSGFAVLAYALGTGCAWQIRRFHDGNILWGLLYPLPVAILGLATITSAFRKLAGRGVHWRGRTYEVR